MDLKIGVIHTGKEIELEIDDSGPVSEQIEQALTSGARIIWLTDNKGRKVGVVADRLAYVEFGVPEEAKVVGFGRS